MQKLLVAKIISALLGICIIACVVAIFFKILNNIRSNSNPASHYQEISLPQNSNIKNIIAESGYVYVWVTTEQEDSVIIINPKKSNKPTTIKLKKEPTDVR